MEQTKYTLAQSTLIEPLVNSWAAWSTLIAPAPSCLHLLRYQIPLLESFLADPALHASACENPELVGGAFIQLPPDRSVEVQHLLEHTKESMRTSIALADAMLVFQQWLLTKAHGLSLESYYSKLPEGLKGYVELIYDYHHRPAVRLIEPLLYQSKYYRPDLQSLHLSKLESDQSRRYFLNTPRFERDASCSFRFAFDDPRTEELFLLDTGPRTLTELRETLNLDGCQAEALLPLLVEASRSPRPSWNEPITRIRYFGHACLLIEWKGISILTDPFVPARPVQGGLERFSFDDLPERIDFALVTHNHNDHFVLEPLLRLRHRIQCLVVPRTFGILWGDISLRLMAQKLGFKNVIEVETLESIPVPNGEIISAPFLGEHSEVAHGKTGYVIRNRGTRMLVAADSDCLDPHMYEHLRKCIGPVDTVFLGMESVGAPLSFGYGHLFPERPPKEFEESRRQHGCNASRGAELLGRLGSSRVYNYAMGLEPWMEHIMGLGLGPDSPQVLESNALLANARARGFAVAERLYGKREFTLEAPPAPSIVSGFSSIEEPAREPEPEIADFVF